jgi:hypothetical protein
MTYEDVTPVPHIGNWGLNVETAGRFYLEFGKQYDKDANLVSDKPSQLRDGTPAQEVEVKWVYSDGSPLNFFALTMKMGDGAASVGVVSWVKLTEDLKSIPYSLQYQPGKDVPVKVPSDVQEFLDRWCSDIVSHDVEKVMTHYSDKYLESAARKGGVEKSWRSRIDPITSFEVGITEFVTANDQVYLAGFQIRNSLKGMLRGSSIIKENGVWKWYGNQRNPPPGQ